MALALSEIVKKLKKPGSEDIGEMAMSLAPQEAPMDLASNAGFSQQKQGEMAAAKVAETPVVAEAKPNNKDYSWDGNEKLYTALAATLPTILGAAIGGAEGGQMGAGATSKFFGDIAQAKLAESKEEKELQAKKELAQLSAQEKKEAAKAAAAEKAASRAEAQKDRMMFFREGQQERAMAREEKREEKQADIERKKKEGVIEVEDRYATIDNNVKALKELVDKTGGFDFTGPENKQMEQLIDSIAVDMAKLVDPQSVARESEVAQAKKLLFEPGFWERKSNIQRTLDSFKEIAKRKRESAYKVRGLDMPKQADQKPKTVIQNGVTYTLNPETGDYE